MASPPRPSPRQPREEGRPAGKGQPRSAREAARGHHRVTSRRRGPEGGATKEDAREGRSQGRAGTTELQGVTGAEQPPADPVRKEKNLGGAVEEGDEWIPDWTRPDQRRGRG